MIYLASPYSHPDPAIREARFYAACRATAELVRTGHAVFSPIVHGHPLVRFGLPVDWSFWERHDRSYLERSNALVVLMLDGWQTSVGVVAEIAIARALGLPVAFTRPTTLPTVAFVAKEVVPW